MAGVEVDATQFVEVGPGRLHELDGAVNVSREKFVAGVRGVTRETLVPAVHFAQVGESTLGEGTNKVERRYCRVVSLHEPLRVSLT